MQTAFVFESPAPDGVSMPLILYRVSADAPLLRRYQEIFLNSEWFPNAREKMLQSGR
jgi:hypothetical protein